MALLDRIKFNPQDNNWLVFKYPNEDFVLGSQLIVGEGQIAVFVKGGRACDLFGPGTHTLNTKNLPILEKLINLPFGGDTPFTAEIYYINTTAKLDLLWGTKTPIQVVDPKYNIRINVRSFGKYGIRVADYYTYLTQIVGTLPSNGVSDYYQILDYFEGVIVAKTVTSLSKYIIEKKISVLEMTALQDELSTACREAITNEFEKWGLELLNYFIESINFPDEDTERLNKLLEQKVELDMLVGNPNYSKLRSFDVMETMAGNPGGGGIANAGIGLGIGLGAANSFGAIFQNIAGNTINPLTTCTKCSAQNALGSKFCSNCGQGMNLAQTSFCAQCGTQNTFGNKFCVQCGVQFNTQQTCTRCGQVLIQGTRFCANCGKGVTP